MLLRAKEFLESMISEYSCEVSNDDVQIAFSSKNDSNFFAFIKKSDYRGKNA